ncbi:lysophosphatidylcholine acyltransferase 1-like [Symsagittifera roscoffensis]|uniref:lysophosphatidylcholine acyltransferase 1-like n=1 Tax=Symsagittifera roscoffensis TaxID=84072 RepID=UPI00307BEB31
MDGKSDLNPFYHELHYSTYQIVKIVLMSVFVVPLRLIAVTFALSLGWLICVLTVRGLTHEELKKPLRGWRRWIQRELGPPVAQFVFFTIGFLFIRTRGRRATKKEAPILTMAPHSSWTDALLHFVDDISSPVSRMDNAELPIIGAMVKFLQPVCVSRDMANSRSDSLNEIKRRAKQPENSSDTSAIDWKQVALFPEGTTTNRKCLISFKTGAFQPGVPVQPVVVRWPNYFDCVTWAFVGPSVYKLIWLQMCQPITFVEVEYLPVYIPSEEEKENPTLFANNVRQVMASALKIPVRNYSHRDGVQFRRRFLASQHGWTTKFTILEKLAQKIGLVPKMLEDVVKYLSQKQHSADLISREYLEDLIGLEAETKSKMDVRESYEEFLPLIQNAEGAISLQKFIVLVSLWLCKKQKAVEPLKYLIQASGIDDMSQLSRTSVENCLKTIFPSNFQSKSDLIADMFKLNAISFDRLKNGLIRDDNDIFS